MIGPNVIQAIIDDTGDNWKGFPFLFAICAAASLIIWFGEYLILVQPCEKSNIVVGVDVTTGRRDAVAWAERNRRYAETGVFGEEDSVIDGESGKRA